MVESDSSQYWHGNSTSYPSPPVVALLVNGKRAPHGDASSFHVAQKPAEIGVEVLRTEAVVQMPRRHHLRSVECDSTHVWRFLTHVWQGTILYFHHSVPIPVLVTKPWIYDETVSSPSPHECHLSSRWTYGRMADLSISASSLSRKDWRSCVRSAKGRERLMWSGSGAPRSLVSRLIMWQVSDERLRLALAITSCKWVDSASEGHPPLY